MFISVIICTIGRESIYLTLNSILNNDFKKYEIILISQKKKFNNGKNSSKRIRYFNLEGLGLSRARNFGIDESRGDIICFTDDDCIVDKNWLEQIHISFFQNREIIGLYGRTEPYNPHLHPRERCPCIFIKKQKKIIDKPCYHSDYYGYGNTMSFRKQAFIKHGKFKEWLGLNSIGQSAEDAEFSLRLLLKGEKILFNPNAVVFHNRWLSPSQYKQKILLDICGELSCYGYFAFQGYEFGKKVLVLNIKKILWQLNYIITLFLRLKKEFFIETLYYLPTQFTKIKGLLIAYYFYKTDPIKKVILPHVHLQKNITRD